MDSINAVLFDLDGTLLDTAPDILASINATLLHHGFEETSLDIVSAGISHGAAWIFQQLTGHAVKQHQQLLQYFFKHYQQSSYANTQIFAGINELLDYLKQSNIVWGIVTNKSSRFTLPILKHMKLDQLASCIISGDTTDHRKPHPAPVLLACQQIAIAPKNTLFFGDHEKDIVAGHAAGTCTAFAKYGYIDADLQNSGKFETAAAHTIDHPMQLADIINQINRASI